MRSCTAVHSQPPSRCSPLLARHDRFSYAISSSPVAHRRAGTKLGRAAQVPHASYSGSKKVTNKYRSRQDLEQAYFRDWEETTVVAEEEGRRKLTTLTLLAFLPNFFKFYIIPGPLRFLWFFVWSALRRGAYQLRKAAVLAGLRVEAVVKRRQGLAAQEGMRSAALRRLHGKDSLFSPLQSLLG